MVLENLLFWAAAKGQTSDQLQQAIDWSRDWLGREQEWTTPLMADVRFAAGRVPELPVVAQRTGRSPEDIDRLVTALLRHPGRASAVATALERAGKSSLDVACSRCIEDVKSTNGM